MRILKDTSDFNKETILNSFPKELKFDVEKVIEFLNDRKLNIHPILEKKIEINGETLALPCRIYCDDYNRNEEENLSEKQKVILNCLFLSHNNGYERQKRLEMLVSENDYYTVPFKIKILGEYVIEIINDLEKHINAETLKNYVSFAKENPHYWKTTKSRIASYWGEYYKRNSKLKDYIGYKIAKKIDLSLQNK